MMESAEMGRGRVHAEEMLPLLKRHEIQVLIRAGHSQKDVAARTGVSLDSVRRVKVEAEVTTVDDAAARRERKIGRPSKATPFATRVATWLAEDPELPTQELLRRATEVGYGGHKTAFYALVAGLRPPRATHIAGTLFLYEDRLRIVAGRFEVLHRRRTKGEPPAPLPEHRAAKVAAVHGKRAKLYEKRQQILNLGPDALALLTEITHREPKLAGRRVEDLYALLEQHGDDALRAAITRAVKAGRLTVLGVTRALRTEGARRPDGESRRAGAAQPRGQHARQLGLPLVRADRQGGAA